MIEPRPFATLGTADFGWLQPHYHFSFSSYYNPARMGHGALRVINDDVIAPHRGFDMHPHRDMEIITYVREGAIAHRDSLGNEGVTHAGEVQVMSAGTGITHAEHNETDVSTKLYQIWIVPRENGVAPRWEHAAFPNKQGLHLLVSGRAGDAGKGALIIHQDAAIYAGQLAATTRESHAMTGDGYVLVATGDITVNVVRLQQGDGAAITAENMLEIQAYSDSEVLIIEIPPIQTI